MFILVALPTIVGIIILAVDGPGMWPGLLLGWALSQAVTFWTIRRAARDGILLMRRKP